MGLGYDQVLFINNGGAGGHVLIADFRTGGSPPAIVRYFESYGDSDILDGWHLLSQDIKLVGRFVFSP